MKLISSYNKITTRAPYGYVIRPLLFLIASSDNLRCILFADDTNLISKNTMNQEKVKIDSSQQTYFQLEQNAVITF